MQNSISHIAAEEILDSRGNPTLRVWAHAGGIGEFCEVPSGASTGSYEAHELRDGELRFGGKGVQRAVDNVTQRICQELTGVDVTQQVTIDSKLLNLDGTPNKTELGGNAMIGTSVACAKVAARLTGNDLFQYFQSIAGIKKSRLKPLLYANVLNGGKHAPSGKGFQEFVVIPITDSIHEATEIIYALQVFIKQILINKYGPLAAGLGDEGGCAVDSTLVTEPLDILREAISKLESDIEVKIAIDVAAQSFYSNGLYTPDNSQYDANALKELYLTLVQNYPILSIEDPFEENDFASFASLNADSNILVVGDDLTVTNKERLDTAIEQGSIGGIIIKPNQIGTLSETLETMAHARNNGIECIVSHRSGETNDTFIADLAYAFGTYGIKLGGMQRGERIAKYNRLLQLERING